MRLDELAFRDACTNARFLRIQVPPQASRVAVVIFAINLYFVLFQQLANPGHDPFVTFGNPDVIGNRMNSRALDCPFRFVIEIGD